MRYGKSKIADKNGKCPKTYRGFHIRFWIYVHYYSRNNRFADSVVLNGLTIKCGDILKLNNLIWIVVKQNTQEFGQGFCFICCSVDGWSSVGSFLDGVAQDMDNGTDAVIMGNETKDMSNQTEMTNATTAIPINETGNPIVDSLKDIFGR